MKICFYYYNINAIGGIESWLYYIGKLYGKNRDITVYYETADEKQLTRLMKYVKVRRYFGQKVVCDKAIFCRNMYCIDNFVAKEYIQFVHGIFTEVGYKKLDTHPRIDRHIAVSKVAADSFEKLTGKHCEVIYNPICIDKPRKVLKLISATRISEDKGSIWERMKILANRLNENNIPFIWLVFTNNPKPCNIKGIVFMEPELSITDYIKESDYMVQLSKSESYSYTAVESLSLGVPVIVNNFSVIGEIGIKDGENGYVLDMSMNNVDVNRIYNEIPNKFKYNGNEFNEEYLKLLGEEDKNRKDDDIVKVKCVFEDGFFDNEYGKHRKYGDIWTTDRQRAGSLEYFSGPDFTKYKLIDIID